MKFDSFSVVVGTYGDPDWKNTAQRALASVEAQTVAPVSVHHVHGETLAQARNQGISEASGDWIICLDADDELDSHYVEAMTKAVKYGQWLLQPATLGIVNGVEDAVPVVIPRRPLHTGNFMVIGTAVRKQLLMNVGGFHEYPMYEDWELFIRCWKAGAQFRAVPDAVYRVHVNPYGRNSADSKEQVKWFNEIRDAHFPGR